MVNVTILVFEEDFTFLKEQKLCVMDKYHKMKRTYDSTVKYYSLLAF